MFNYACFHIYLVQPGILGTTPQAPITIFTYLVYSITAQAVNAGLGKVFFKVVVLFRVIIYPSKISAYPYPARGGRAGGRGGGGGGGGGGAGGGGDEGS